MHLLTRTVRVHILPRGIAPGVSRNTFAGFPTLTGLGVATSLDVSVRGEPDSLGGYVLDIKTIDRAVHDVALPLLSSAYQGAFEGRAASPSEILRDVTLALRAALPRPLHRVRWHLTPFASWEIRMHDTMNTPTHATLRQTFDFAAAHRLHVPSKSDAENRALFGKCNNPAGHGHNYQLVASVRVPIHGTFRLDDLEAIVTRVILDPLDHKHLNEDVPAFQVARGGVNPSVENIARVCYDWLAPALRTAHTGVELADVTVWETDRTSATYPAHA